MLQLTIPIELPSLANQRLHWRATASLKKRQKQATALCLYGCELPPLPVVVTLTRFGPRKLDDDNLAISCKYVRDEIARKYGVDDGSDQYTWVYQQDITKTYGVEVLIITVPPLPS